VTRRGMPWTKSSLGTESVAAARAAGIVGKSAHGMREAAATRAAESGATERELEAGPAGGVASPFTQCAHPQPTCKRGHWQARPCPRPNIEHLFPHLRLRCGPESGKVNKISPLFFG